MPDQQQNEAQQPPDDGQQQRAGSTLMKKLKIAAMVAGVVLVECACAYFFIPSAAADPQASEAAIKAAEAELLGDKEENTEVEDEIEVDLGEFRVTSYQPATDTTFRVNFHLFGTIVEEDKDEFDVLKEANEARLREQVNVIVRSAEIPDLTDPNLGLIKRRILDKINRILGKQVVKGVIFSDMSFVEQ